jgi:hypothetical protein
MSNYNEFRNSVLDNYDKFLEDTWKEYDQNKGVERCPSPKPPRAPIAMPDEAPMVTQLPTPTKKPNADTTATPTKPRRPRKPKPTPAVDTPPAPPAEPIAAAPVKRAEPITPTTTPAAPSVAPTSPIAPIVPSAPTVSILPPSPAQPTAENPVEPIDLTSTPSIMPSSPIAPIVPSAPTVSILPPSPAQPTAENPVEPIDLTSAPSIVPVPFAPITPSAPTVAILPSSQPVEDTPAEPTTPPENSDQFLLADVNLYVTHYSYNINQQLNNRQEYGAQWRSLKSSDIASKLIPEFDRITDTYGLNDYLTFQAVKSYVDTRFSGVHSSSRFSLLHYILANMGYDVRLGSNSHGNAMLLVNFQQMVYVRPYLNIDGKKYFIFADDNVDLSTPENLRISTCALPSDADTGQALDLVINDLRLPYDPYHYDIKYGKLEISGEFNRNIIPLLYHYPQMPIEDFARSTVLPNVRQQVVDQIKQELAEMNEKTAVNTLLHFVQSAFEYATDDDFHGFEKPYFFEETLYYPKNDCEDRSIFYTYLLWEVLHVPNQLLSYPGHESVAVSLQDPVKGTSYTDDGKTFYISDPTYIGSNTGMCMPSYVSTTPEIDFTYK